MAEKYLPLQNAQRDSICVVANVKNARFMVVVRENCYISDLIKEVEDTFVRLSSTKVSIKTLKNSNNAVLPEWYLVTPLLKNHDEVFGFGEKTELTSKDVTKCGHICHNAMNNASSSSGLFVLPDSGFTSPVDRPLLTSREEDRSQGNTGTHEDRAEDIVNRVDGNLSQDEGNEVLSEIFSIKDHNYGNSSKPKPDNQVLKNGNVNGALQGNVVEESKNNQSSDESSWASHKSSRKKAKDTSKTAQQNKISQNSDTFKLNESAQKATQSGKDLQQSKSTESPQTRAKKDDATKSASAAHDSDTDEDSTDSETVDPDDTHENKDKIVANVSGEQKKLFSDENMEITAKDSSVLKVEKVESRAKAGNKERESNDSSSESEGMDVDNVDNSGKNIVVVTSGSATESKGLKNGGSSNKVKISSADERAGNKNASKKTKDNTRNKTVKSTMKNDAKDKTNRSDAKSKPGKTRNQSVESEDGSSSDSSSSSSETESDEGETSRKQKDDVKKTSESIFKNNDVSKSGVKIADARMTTETGATGKDVVKEKPDSESESSSVTDSSWSSVDDQGKNGKKVKDKSAEKSKSQSKTEGKLSGEGKVEEKPTKTGNKNKQTELDRPEKSAGDEKRRKELSPTKSVARSVSRSKMSVSPRLKVKLKKLEKVKGKDTKAETKSDDESSVSTLKPLFTPVPEKGKEKSKGQSESGDSRSDDEDAAKKGEEIVKTPRKSASLLSASKVASWLLSNPVSENEEQMSQTEKNKDDGINEKEASVSKSALKQKANSDNKTKKNLESLVDKICSDDKQVKAEETVKPQKRKLDEESEQEQSTKSKKSKKKKSSDRTKNEKQLNGEIKDEQDKSAFKHPVTPKKGKNISLSLPKTSRGLEVLVEDESDYTTVSAKISKKQRLALPRINDRAKPTGFLSKSNSTDRKVNGATKTQKKSQVKKPSSSQSRKTVEMNSNEEDYINNVDLNLDTILNDKSIKW